MKKSSNTLARTRQLLQTGTFPEILRDANTDVLARVIAEDGDAAAKLLDRRLCEALPSVAELPSFEDVRRKDDEPALGKLTWRQVADLDSHPFYGLVVLGVIGRRATPESSIVIGCIQRSKAAMTTDASLPVNPKRVPVSDRLVSYQDAR